MAREITDAYNGNRISVSTDTLAVPNTPRSMREGWSDDKRLIVVESTGPKGGSSARLELTPENARELGSRLLEQGCE